MWLRIKINGKSSKTNFFEWNLILMKKDGFAKKNASKRETF